MSEFPLIGLVGPPASGKTVAASRIIEMGASRVRMGDIVVDEINKRNLEVNEENMGKIANKMREERGMDAIAKRCISKIKRKGKESGPVIVDGIRGIAEVKRFEKEFGDDFYLLSIDASERTRFERVKNRNREDDAQDFEDFKRKDIRESGWGLREAINSADYTIVNEGSIEELEDKVSEFYEEVMEKYEGRSES